MKAPNGKPSNLTPEQWKLVRTPQFKAWFGDWENEPENSSKVIDENGEPLVMFSGSPYKFNEFKSFEVEVDRDDREFKPRFWFTKDRELAERYSKKGFGDKVIYTCFLNVRKSKGDFNLYADENFDGSIEKVAQKINVVIATNSNQIKLADGTNTTFDGSNPDIRFAEGGKTKRTMKRIKRGGITYGKSHAEGGIPVKNQSTGDMLEVEGGEGIVNKRSMASDKKVKLNGKEMTICEAVSQLNQLEGGVQFSCDDVSDRQFIEAMAKGGELERGTRTEKEHIQVLKDLYAKRITPKEASKRIAKDHLKEDTHYYSKLAKMEGKMAQGGEVYRKEKIELQLDAYTDSIYFNSSYGTSKYGFNEVNVVVYMVRDEYGYAKMKGKYVVIDTESEQIEGRSNDKKIFNTKEEAVIYIEKNHSNENEQYAQGGEIFDKETEDYLSELTKKFAKGGEVVADKTETINMKDFEGYADQYNGRKNKFFKATDEFQLIVNEAMDVKNNKDLPQDEKDKLLADLREKAREAKTKLNEERKDFVDMRDVKSPFYAPQLADGGIFSSLPKSVRIPHELKEIVKSKSEFPLDKEYQFYISKSERFPKIISKGVSAKFKLVTLKEGLSTRILFSISSKATYERDDIGVWENVAKTLEVIPSLKSDISSISVNKIARGYDVYFFITKPLSFIDTYNITANVIQNLIDYDSFNSFRKLFKEGEKAIPPTEKEDDWNWRFKTEDELRAELGGDLHKLKDGNVFAISMRYLLGKKIKETTESVDAIFRINQNTYSGINVNTEKEFGISNPERDNEWSISKWMITDKPLEGEEVPPTEEKKEIIHMDTETEILRWAGEKVKEKNDVNTRKYQVHHLVAYILLNQSNARMSDFTQLIAMAKQTEKLSKEVLRLTEEGISLDSFVMKLVLNRYLESLEDVKSQIMLFVKYERDVEQELGRIVLNIPYLAELDTFDKDYILYIK
jgi:hypothetical protein